MNIVGIQNVLKKLNLKFDSELRSIAQLIKNVGQCDSYSGYDKELIKDCNKVFIERLKTYPIALKMSFWEQHFEWKALKEYPEINGRVLDFGCGSGHSDILLARQGYRITGIDMSPIGINIANHLKGQEDIAIKERLEFFMADITRDLPPGELFDSAWASHVFEHIVNPEPILNGLRRWLSPGAYLLISVPLGHAYDDPSHVHHFFNPRELERHLNGYLTVQRIRSCNEYKVIRALCRFT